MLANRMSVVSRGASIARVKVSMICEVSVPGYYLNNRRSRLLAVSDGIAVLFDTVNHTVSNWFPLGLINMNVQLVHVSCPRKQGIFPIFSLYFDFQGSAWQPVGESHR